MAVPRKVFILNTKYFDILFSNKSKETAQFLAQNADSLYEKAMEYLGVKQSFRIPVVISPDSDILEISYSPIPYNRIVVSEGVPELEQACYKDSMLSLFYHQVVLAVNESIRSPFVQTIYSIVHIDALQPVALTNLPFSFVEGIAYLQESEDEEGRMNDRYFLQILSQAKYENNFPTWFQACAVRDTYPGKKLALAAGSAFSAFLQQKWGFQKYAELWEECSKFHFMFTAGIFYKVYGISIDNAWKEFEESIPLPQNYAEFEEMEKCSQMLFLPDGEANFAHILASDYGFVWYDSIKHEVDIFDVNSQLKIRQLLFLADSVDRLTLSPDGRYITVSYTGIKNRSNHSKKLTRIYDLKNRVYVSSTFEVRDGTIILLENGHYALAGVNVENRYPILQVFDLGTNITKEEAPLVFERAYDFNTIPFSPVYAGKGKMSCVISQNNKWSLCQIDLNSGIEKSWTISDLPISMLKYSKNKNRYTFQFVPENQCAFTRMGYVELSEAFEPTEVFLQTTDFNGGVNSPVFYKNKIIFSSHKLFYDDFEVLPDILFTFEKGEIKQLDEQNKRYIPEADETDLGELYDLKKYHPIKYLFSGTVYPFLPVKNIDLDEGVTYWPGLGLSYSTHSDLFENTIMTLSGAYAYVNLEYTKLKNPPADEIEMQKLEDEKLNKYDFTFSGYIKNTSTPVDIAAASLFLCDLDGTYDWSIFGGVAWNVPIGMTMRNLRIKLQTEYDFSSEYYDTQKSELNPEQYPVLSNWKAPLESYQTFEASANVLYVNMSQYGSSKFEKRGVELGTKMYALRDFTDKTNLFSVSVNAAFAIPRLTPLPTINGWVLSAPAMLFAEFNGKHGTALETSAEILLLGKEIQNGFPFIYLYFHRLGLKAGYDLCLNYDATSIKQPDFRNVAKFYTIFYQTHIFDSFFFKLDLDFIPPIGRLSYSIFKCEGKVEIFPKTKGYKLSFNIDVEM